ncbi:MAG: VTT domain-containing protein [Syntrophorhabdales bacterium]|jgi:uncharacterized membrane protein YdjX (TVP38/TMEM64 family)
MSPRRSPSSYLILLLKAVSGLLLIAALASILYFYHEGEWRELFFRFKYFFSFSRLRAFILSFGAYSVVVFVLLQAFQVLFAPVPGEITGFVGGYLWGMVTGTVLSTIGLTIGSALAFEVTRVFGTRLVRKIVRREAMERFDDFVTHRGLHLVFILFLVPGFPKDSLCYLLGLTRLRRLDFLIINVLGRLPGTLVLTIEGEAVRTGRYKAFFWILALSVLLTAVLYLLKPWLARFFSRMAGKIFMKGH